jgi:uncharacterized damage-inducible protein DinB
MEYAMHAIDDAEIPRAAAPIFQHLLGTYVSETNKTAAVWRELKDDQLDFRPHARSSSIRDIIKHQILSERRFFAEFLGFAEPPADRLLPAGEQPSVRAYIERYVALARPRLAPIAGGDEGYWLAEVPFFDVRRERIWVFWRRVLHTAHHRAQVGVALRLLEDRVPATYGPTADVTWRGADPTTTVAAAARGAGATIVERAGAAAPAGPSPVREGNVMTPDPQGALKPIAPTRVAEELKRLSSQRASGDLDRDEYEHRFSRMISELRDRRIDGNRAEILAVLSPLQQDGTVTPDDWHRLIRQLGLG